MIPAPGPSLAVISASRGRLCVSTNYKITE
ncbi:MAG: hypothetical protein JWN52_6476 [Actinomycetia bacterium]|nr:hypothetical protein [Actinomycetes bacterium]